MMNSGMFSTRLTKILSRTAAVIVLVTAAMPAAPLGAAGASSSDPAASPGRAVAAAVSTPQPTQIVAGGRHTCALTPQGGVFCWGLNYYHELGNGTTTDSPVPVPVTGLRSDVMGLSLSGERTCALTIYGKVFCWGSHYDFSGYDATPVEISGLGRQVIQVAVSDVHVCALTSAGSVLCWGQNADGELGDGSGIDSPTPVTAISTGAIQVAVSDRTSCAVMTTGEVKCWGDGSLGELGDGQGGGSHSSLVPVSVLIVGGSPLTGATQVSLGVGGSTTCALVNGGVQCWGANNYGQLGNGTSDLDPHPYASPVLTALAGPALSGVDMLATGGFFSCVHLSIGNTQCWGANSYGALGDGSTTDRYTPVNVVGLPAGVTALTAGNLHTCVFTSWENVHPFWCWGYNPYGELGNATTTNSSVPVPVADISGLGNGALQEPQIVAGGAHTCSLTTGEGLKCWGSNPNGQLGDGTTTDHQNPVDVPGLSSGVKSMALGDNFTCALLPWGRLKCWGENTHGQLGDGNKTDSPLPVTVLPDVTVKQVAAGSQHACVLTLDGSVLCWGDNTSGQLGDGSTTESVSPVVAIATGAVGIALGGSTSCVLMSGGGVKCWGLGDMGQLGDGGSGAGHKQTSATDVQVSGGAALAGATQVAVGANFGCALLTGGLVDCWGKNDVGQLGQGATSALSAHASPVLTEAGGDPLEAAMQVSAGGAHACVRMYTDRLKCWGRGELGQLGDGSSGSGIYSDIPHTVVDHYAPYATSIPYLEVVSQVSAGGAHTCAFLKWDGTNPYRCWGDDSRGQLGDGDGNSSGQVGKSSSSTFQLYPNPVKDSQNFGSPPLDKIVAGSGYSCALTPAGGVKCWGTNAGGQLGNGYGPDSLTPVQVSGLESGVVSLAAGDSHACALTAAGGVKCWGLNFWGELGNGTNSSSPTPVDVSGLTAGVTAITAGDNHTCALVSAGGVKCWGMNNKDQLGNGTSTDSPVPVDVHGLIGGLVGLVAGGNHTCVLTSVGGVQCWGANSAGQLGNGSTLNSDVPVDVTGLASGVVAVGAGLYHTCALTSYGGVKCWGDNTWSQLGDGTNTNSLTPVDVSGLTTSVIGMAAGMEFTCALTATDVVRCWGENGSGQLGDGSTTGSNIPVDVKGLPSGVTSIATGAHHACAVLAGTGPLRCWGSNAYGQLGTGDTDDEKGPVVSKWLTADGLVEDQKAQVIILPNPVTVLVIPAQPVTTPVVVTATEVTTPPAPCTNCAAPSEVPAVNVAVSSHVLVQVHWVIHFPNWPPASSLKSAAAIDEQSLNLYHYVNGTWIPMLPCTGCSLDTVNHVLIATMDGEGIYEVMGQLPSSSLKNVYLPLVMR